MNKPFVTSNRKLVITQSLIDDIVSHAKDGLPNEACGYLAGNDDKVEKFYPMRNVDESPEHFSFDPKEQFAAVKDARSLGLKLIAVYHSHPETPARLSKEDILELNDASMIYILVSFAAEEPDVKAYTLNKPDDHSIEIGRVEIEVA